MKKIFIIAIKEWRGYFANPLGFVFGGLMLLVANWLYWGDIFILGQADFRNYMSILSYLLTIFIPAIAMSLLADEKRTGTWETILATPVQEKELVLGKFFGSWLYFLTILLLSLPALLTLRILGQFDPGIIIGGYLGILLLAGSYLAIGLYFSSWSNQPVVGFLATTIFLLVGNLLSADIMSSRLPWWLSQIANYISLPERAAKFFNGSVRLDDTIFLLSVMIVALLSTINLLKNKER